MAAPSGTTWGKIKSGGTYLKGRIGLYITTSSTSTQTTATVQVWFWSIYSITDSYNTLYLSNNSSSATKSRGNVSINTTVNSGGGWSTSNQKKLGTWTFTMARKASKRTINVAAKLSTIDVIGSSMYVSKTYTVPALASYTLTYDANGGTEAPDPQSMPANTATAISSDKPVRSGYVFQGWGETSTATAVSWKPGETITITDNKTIYAIWKASDGKVNLFYNANGGSGAPANQSVAENGTLTVSSTKPTKSGYSFVNWNTGANGEGTSYTGGSSIKMGEIDVTLYAQWTEKDEFYITYNANGGSGAPATGIKAHKKPFKLSASKPTRSGYTFKCWTTTASMDEEDFETYYPKTYYLEDSDITLYAQWVENDKIYFYGSGDCECVEFIEGSSYSFTKAGQVKAPAFIETEDTESMNFTSSGYTISELIEK